MSARSEFEAETLRLSRRYVVEIVERFGLCPWADRALREGHVTEVVFEQTSPDLFEPSLACMHELAGQNAIDVALFIYPRISLNRLDFEHFARRLRGFDAERYAPGKIPFAIAAFHPEAAPVLDNPDRLVPFLRRTPDPTLQLVRETTLTRVRGDLHGTSFYDPLTFHENARDPTGIDVRERVARTNHETVERLGVAVLEEVFADIIRDRNETYARLSSGDVR